VKPRIKISLFFAVSFLLAAVSSFADAELKNVDYVFTENNIVTKGNADLEIVEYNGEKYVKITQAADDLFSDFAHLKNLSADAKTYLSAKNWDTPLLSKLDADIANTAFKNAIKQKPQLIDAWEGLINTGLRTDVSWLNSISKWIDDGYEFIETSAGVIIKSNGEEVVEIVGDVPKWTKHKIIPQNNSSIIKSANDINPEYIGWDPPYHVDYPVIDFKTTSNESFVRVFRQGENSAEGAFIMKQSNLVGLTPVQIKDKFALNFVPNKIVDVNVPSGTNLRIGKVAPRPNGTSGGKIQFELKDQISSSNFTNIRDL